VSSEKPVTPSLIDGGQLRRATVLAAIYAVIVTASFYTAYEIRFDFLVPEEHQAERLRLLPLVIGIKLIALVACRQLGSLMTYFSVPDLIRLFWAMLASSAILLIPRILGWPTFAAPRGVLLTDLMLAFGGLSAGRLATRLYRERLSGSKQSGEIGHRQIQRIAIIGAGDAGAALAKEFINAPSRGFRPVMFFDDDSSKHGKLVHGVPVLGRPETIAEARGNETLVKAVIAMPSASARRIREIVAVLSEQGIKMETLPSLEELASGRVKVSRVRPVEVQDLLGRKVVDLDTKGIKGALETKVVLVTGAGGSIGSELCRQIVALNPKRLLLVEQSEAALFVIEQELNEHGFSGVIVPLVADILDRARMEYIFGRYHPQVIFHAAAHKHVYLMERQPAEAIRNNAVGTRQLAEMAAAHGVEGFVFISTDKAINPTNVMGATKRLAELQLMAVAAAQGAAGEDVRDMEDMGDKKDDEDGRDGGSDGSSRLEAAQGSESRVLPQSSSSLPSLALSRSADVSRSSSSAMPTKFMAVRFGNVLGSSGSVIPIFKRQIANGGPVTVTHPDVTRYFMTIPEAVGLVLQSFVQGKGGEIFVLDMGKPVKIVDLAKQMIELSGFRVGDDIEIVFSGLKPGEKLFEELQHHTEEYAPTGHPRIMQFRGNGTFDRSVLAELEQRLHSLDSNQLKEALKMIVPEYTPHLD
jgi:FlaA1/EpsC-like NDP-sugar epimerase